MNQKSTISIMRSILLLIIIMTASISHASQTLIVPTNYASIQSALNAANDNDVVYIEDGTYRENLILILNKNITIEGSSENVIIDGTNQNRCLNVIGNTEALYTLTIKNVKLINGHSETEGGALKASNISLNLNGVYIENSYSSTKAGAIYFQGVALVINNCHISNNSSQDCGGIYAVGTNLDLTSSIFEKNISISSDARGQEKSGGAVMIFGNYTIQSCEFTSNKSFYGGGLWCTGNGAISATKFNNNTSRAWLGSALSVDGNSVITDIQVDNNSSSEEAAIVMFGNCTIRNSTFTDNKGSVFNPGLGTHTIENCKLLNNTLGVGYSGWNYRGSIGKIILKHTEIAYNKIVNNLTIEPTNYAIKRYDQGIELVDCQIMGYYYGIYSDRTNWEAITLTQTTISNCMYGVWNGNDVMNITNCNICSNQNGILNKGTGSVTVSGSNLYDNDDFAVKNENDSKLIDCKNNYWGHESGPLHPLFNASGQGDETNEYVDVMPFSGQVNDIGVIHPIEITSINYLDNGFEIKYHTYQNNVNKISINIVGKYSAEQYIFEYDINNQIVINDLINGQYLIYASYVTTEGIQSNKSFAYDFKHFNGEKSIIVPTQYPNIASALAEAEDGFTIYVADGTYNESINYYDFKKDVSLIGNPEQPENVIINGQGKDEGCLWIRGSYSQPGARISIDGFTFTRGSGYYCGALRFDEVSAVEVKNCIVYGNTNSQGAIRIHSCANALLNHTLVHSNSGSYCGGVWSSRSTLTVDRSTFVYNSSTDQYYGSDLYAQDCNVQVNNSIVWNSNNYAIDINNANILLDYCCLNSALLNQSITAANSIHSDPKFKSKEENDYSLSDESPCIAAGDPNHDLSIGGAINMGYYGQNTSTSIVNELNSEPYKLFVMGNSITIEFDKEQPIIDLRIYDLSGKLVSAGKQNNISRVKYSFSDNNIGVFILHFRLKNSTVIEKVLLK